MQVCDIIPELQVSLTTVNALVGQLDCTSCSLLCKGVFIILKERLVAHGSKMLSFVGSYLIFFFVHCVVCVSLSH